MGNSAFDRIRGSNASVTPQDLEQYAARFDRDSDGNLDFNELTAMYKDLGASNTSADSAAQKTLNEFDTTISGSTPSNTTIGADRKIQYKSYRMFDWSGELGALARKFALVGRDASPPGPYSQTNDKNYKFNETQFTNLLNYFGINLRTNNAVEPTQNNELENMNQAKTLKNQYKLSVLSRSAPIYNQGQNRYLENNLSVNDAYNLYVQDLAKLGLTLRDVK